MYYQSCFHQIDRTESEENSIKSTSLKQQESSDSQMLHTQSDVNHIVSDDEENFMHTPEAEVHLLYFYSPLSNLSQKLLSGVDFINHLYQDAQQNNLYRYLCYSKTSYGGFQGFRPFLFSSNR